ncbi:PLP-dependent transferase [Thelephora terrestris]|uniref:PLP-dependent transferase n=1 Tax=Thelephora terrestris TaxID=56493 RepID=A0A9P6HMW5_9AGAM|nr:PLP-dependent transferase [Thelephora terrestris]
MTSDKPLETPAPACSASYTGKQPPPFGHQLLKYFSFDPGYVNLNNGSYGATPTPVSEACKVISDEVEANPDKFIRLTYEARWIRCRQRVADLIGAEVEECVLVQNTSHGLDNVLRSIDWKKGDFIIKTNITYGPVVNAIRFIADANPGVILETVDIGPPYALDGIFKSFEEGFKRVQSSPEYAALTEQGQRPRIVVVVDTLSSLPGLLMPWERVVGFCKGHENVWTLVDAAHALGQIVGINLNKTQPDFWISNCHKWMSAKRACAVLYVPRRNQHIIKTTLPTSAFYVSPNDYAKDPTLPKPPNFVKQFEWTGTHDPTPYLSIGPALDFREWLGGEEKINGYCRDLAIRGGQRLAEILGTEEMDQTPNHEVTLNMVNVKLPLPDTPKDAVKVVIDGFFKKKLLLGWNAFAPPFYLHGSWWVRCSAQIWNDISDFEYMGNAYKELSAQVIESIIDEKGELREGYTATISVH